MATQQAWDDFESLKASLLSLSVDVGGMVRGKLASLKATVDALSVDPARLAAAVALADEHPVYNAAKLTELAGKFLTLHEYLLANTFYS
jgi:hypothetical protein